MATNSSSSEKRTGRGGRPPKFGEPSKPVTVTLPARTLSDLSRIDADRARAIVKATDAALQAEKTMSDGVDVVSVSPATALIVVGLNRHLRNVPWLRQAEVAPGRFILSVPSGTALESLEVALRDLLDDIPDDEARERAMTKRLIEVLREMRRGQKYSKEEILLMHAPKKPAGG